MFIIGSNNQYLFETKDASLRFDSFWEGQIQFIIRIRANKQI